MKLTRKQRTRIKEQRRRQQAELDKLFGKPKRVSGAAYRPPTCPPRQYPSKLPTAYTGYKKPRYSSNIVVGQAYNKGGLQVLTQSESNDSRTGKRR